MSISIHNEIEIAISAEDLFNYVTQPWLWHEWHPNSKSARAGHSFLATGDEFEEQIEVQPLAPLPLRMKRTTLYSVTESVPGHTWEAEGHMKNGWLRIRYDFQEEKGVTHFSRLLEFNVTGLDRVLMPVLKVKMERISMVALNNLRQKMQGERDES